MLTKENIKYLIYALLLYIPTLVGMRVELYLLVIGAVAMFERNAIFSEFNAFKSAPFSKKYLGSVWLVLLIVAASLVNKIINGNDIISLRDYYSAFYLFPLLIIVSKYLGNVKVFKLLIYLTLVEVAVGCIEYGTGTRSFFMDLGKDSYFTDRSLLYGSRCFGLSGNSSVFGYKVFIALILIEFTQFNKVLSWTLRGGLLIGLLLSFSRAAVVVIILFWGVRLLYGLFKGYKKREVFRTVPFQFNLLMIVLALALNTGLRYQLSRGGHEAESVFGEKTIIKKEDPKTSAEIHAIEYQQGETDPTKQGWGEKVMMRTEGVQTSGRKLIWLNYLNFIEKELIVGNGSDKVMLRSWQNDTAQYKLIHAHNSLLMMLAMNGLLITGLYFLFYLFNFRSRNFIPILAIVLYSLLNYGIFWGFSYLDVVFIALLTLNFKDSYDYQRES